MAGSVLMLRMNGANGSTTFVDDIGHTVSNTGPASQSNAISGCYGTNTSGSFGGSSFLSVANSTDFDLGTGDYTYEGWGYATNLTGYHIFIGGNDTGTGHQAVLGTNGTGLYFGDYVVDLTGGTISLNTWFHFAVCRVGTTVNMYLNGTSVASGTSSASIQYANGTNNGIYIGCQRNNNSSGGNYFAQGYLADVHIIKGYAKYTGSFSVPTDFVPRYTTVMSASISDSMTLTGSDSYVYHAVNVILDSISSALSVSSSTSSIAVVLGNTSDSFVITPTVGAMAGYNVVALSSFLATGSIPQTIINIGGIANDTLQFAATFALTIPAVVSDQLSLTQEGKAVLAILMTLSGNLTLSATSTAQRACLTTIQDDLDLFDGFTLNGIYQALADSHLLITTKNQSGMQVWSGYCVNRETSATSLYENYKFNSYANIGSRYYASDDKNIYLLDHSDSDNGEAINAMLTTGLVDCGTSLKKSVDNAFLAVSTDGDVFMRVLADGQSYDYKLSRDTNGTFEGARVKIGKGLRAVNWQFEIYNSNGSDFDIDSMKIYPLMLSRHGGGY